MVVITICDLFVFGCIATPLCIMPLYNVYRHAGLMFGERVRYFRLKNSLRLFEKTKALLDAKGIEPTAVPLRILLPLLEGASLEDNQSLADK